MSVISIYCVKTDIVKEDKLNLKSILLVKIY